MWLEIMLSVSHISFIHHPILIRVTIIASPFPILSQPREKLALQPQPQNNMKAQYLANSPNTHQMLKVFMLQGQSIQFCLLQLDNF
jgi:hypothetical protein